MSYITAIDIGGTTMKVGLLNRDGKLLTFFERSTEAQRGMAHLVDSLCEIVSGFESVDCVGISTTGQVDPETGSIAYATEAMPGYTGFPLKQILQQRLSMPISVDNDSNCAAIGETQFGAGRGLDNFICLTFGTGIGGAIVINRKIYTGANGLAGEIGHMVTHSGGRRCVCGERGCYEAYGSASALTENIKASLGKAMNGREIFALLDDAEIKREVDLWINEIVTGLISLANIFDPSCFILGGGVMNQICLLDSINEKLSGSVMLGSRCIAVKQAELGSKAGIMGAFYQTKSL